MLGLKRVPVAWTTVVEDFNSCIHPYFHSGLHRQTWKRDLKRGGAQKRMRRKINVTVKFEETFKMPRRVCEGIVGLGIIPFCLRASNNTCWLVELNSRAAEWLPGLESSPGYISNLSQGFPVTAPSRLWVFIDDWAARLYFWLVPPKAKHEYY